MKHAAILVGGQLEINDNVLKHARETNLVIAADGGARHAKALNLKLDLWVGDFDSSEGLAFPGVARLEFNPDKDSTDFELAIQAAKDAGATRATVFGAFGGRFDHTLAIALSAAKNTLEGFEILLESGFETGWILKPNQALKLPLRQNQTFSLLALSPIVTGLNIRGAKWNLENATLEFGTGFGISNLALGTVNLKLETGFALVIAQNHLEDQKP
jgi:thiamine pyrophosphokinase